MSTMNIQKIKLLSGLFGNKQLFSGAVFGTSPPADQHYQGT